MSSNDGLPDVFTNFLDFENLKPNEVKKKLQVLQSCLADDDWVHGRIVYLEELAAKSRGLVTKGIEPSKGTVDAVSKLGIVGAWEAGYVTASGLGKLAHSISGLRAFNDALLASPPDQLAECWRKAAE